MGEIRKKMDKSLKDYRGQFSKEFIGSVLKDSKMTNSNKKLVLEYLCNGKKIYELVNLSNMSVKKQAIWNRIDRTIKLIEKKGLL
jgi:hypothetical protein